LKQSNLLIKKLKKIKKKKALAEKWSSLHILKQKQKQKKKKNKNKIK
jgi:hypothetical protein